MAQAWWETVDEIKTTPYGPTGPELRLQKGVYHYYDGSPSEDGYRFIWYKNGRLQSRPARIDDMASIDALVTAGRAKGWV
ncbi:protein of unassigned function [Methylobacterium oryzae CBMB20]|uniref:Protein of unassigned function n=1 Tax=Methylobacterium oryzae CBMB20 TaxID=693986 RepID=A0A089NUV3_9HYPH|nr:protein of unassigned function [Methylobacterium oryzae CBMB20]